MDKIYINSFKNRNTGFMSNNSTSVFVLDGHEWPTVSHFINAKHFAGTELEEKIRCSKSAWHAKNIATNFGLENIIFRKKKYEYKKKKIDELECLRRALKAKFEQNPDILERLLLTGKADIFSKFDNNRTGRLLEELRNDYLKSIIKKQEDMKRKEKKSHMLLDFEKGELTPTEKKVISFILAKVGNKSLQESIVRVIILENLLMEANRSKTMKKIDHVFVRRKWAEAFQTMTNFVKKTKQIQQMLKTKDPIQQFFVETSSYICEFLRWVHFRATPAEIEYIKKQSISPRKRKENINVLSTV